MRASRPLLGLLAVLAVGAIDLVHHLPRLPPRVATHFDVAGQPNGWAAPADLARFEAIVVLSIIATLVGGAALVRRLPPSLINVPNKDYWFAPERREASVGRLAGHLLWMAVITAALFVGINHLVYLANLQSGPPRLPALALAGLGAAFLLAIVSWTVRLMIGFRRPPGARD